MYNSKKYVQWFATSNSLNEPDKTIQFYTTRNTAYTDTQLKIQSVLLKQINSAAYEQNKHSRLFSISHIAITTINYKSYLSYLALTEKVHTLSPFSDVFNRTCEDLLNNLAKIKWKEQSEYIYSVQCIQA